MKLYRDFFKRGLDIAVSGTALLVLSVPLAAVTVWLHFANKGAGAFFFQERPGKNGKIFRVVKFKTMTDERDTEGKLLPDADRLTKVGRFVRSTSIDELPQLWNVFKGDMSLIGPRPLLVQYLPLYSPEQARRHELPSRNHRLGSMPRTQCNFMEKEIRIGRVVCRSHLIRHRLQSYTDNAKKSPQSRGYKLSNIRHNGIL